MKVNPLNPQAETKKLELTKRVEKTSKVQPRYFLCLMKERHSSIVDF